MPFFLLPAYLPAFIAIACWIVFLIRSIYFVIGSFVVECSGYTEVVYLYLNCFRRIEIMLIAFSIWSVCFQMLISSKCNFLLNCSLFLLGHSISSFSFASTSLLYSSCSCWCSGIYSLIGLQIRRLPTHLE